MLRKLARQIVFLIFGLSSLSAVAELESNKNLQKQEIGPLAPTHCFRTVYEMIDGGGSFRIFVAACKIEKTVPLRITGSRRLITER